MGSFKCQLLFLVLGFLGQLNWLVLRAEEESEIQTPEVDGLADISAVRVDRLGVLYGIYVRMGEADKAALILEELRNRDPNRAEKAEALVLSRVPQGDEGEESEARRILVEEGPDKAIEYLEKLKAEKFTSQRFPYSVILAEAYLEGGRYQQSRKILDALVESETTPKYEKGAALELQVELNRIKPVETVTTSVELGGDQPYLKSATTGASAGRGEETPKIELTRNHNLTGNADYQSHPDGDLFGFNFCYSQCLRDCMETGLRVRHQTISLEDRGDIRVRDLDREVYSSIAYLRLHCGQGYGEISGGSGSHDRGSVGLTAGRNLKLKNDWGFKFSGEVNQMLDDSIQMMALNATEDRLRLEFNARHEGLAFMLRGEARMVDLNGQDMGSGQAVSWSLSRSIWENEKWAANLRLSYLGSYSRFDGTVFPSFNGNDFFLREISQQGLALSHQQSLGACWQFTGTMGAFGDFEDDEIEFFALGGAQYCPYESLRIGFNAGYYSDGSTLTQDDGSHVRFQTTLQKSF